MTWVILFLLAFTNLATVIVFSRRLERLGSELEVMKAMHVSHEVRINRHVELLVQTAKIISHQARELGEVKDVLKLCAEHVYDLTVAFAKIQNDVVSRQAYFHREGYN